DSAAQALSRSRQVVSQVEEDPAADQRLALLVGLVDRAVDADRLLEQSDRLVDPAEVAPQRGAELQELAVVERIELARLQPLFGFLKTTLGRAVVTEDAARVAEVAQGAGARGGERRFGIALRAEPFGGRKGELGEGEGRRRVARDGTAAVLEQQLDQAQGGEPPLVLDQRPALRRRERCQVPPQLEPLAALLVETCGNAIERERPLRIRGRGSARKSARGQGREALDHQLLAGRADEQVTQDRADLLLRQVVVEEALEGLGVGVAVVHRGRLRIRRVGSTRSPRRRPRATGGG